MATVIKIGDAVRIMSDCAEAKRLFKSEWSGYTELALGKEGRVTHISNSDGVDAFLVRGKDEALVCGMNVWFPANMLTLMRDDTDAAGPSDKKRARELKDDESVSMCTSAAARATADCVVRRSKTRRSSVASVHKDKSPE